MPAPDQVTLPTPCAHGCGRCADVGCAGAMCTEGCAGCGRGVAACDVVGTHRSKERLSAAAQRCRAGLVVVSLKDGSHGSGKKLGYWSTVVSDARGAASQQPATHIVYDDTVGMDSRQLPPKEQG